MNNVISFKNVGLRYDSRRDWTLRDIHLTIAEGEWLTIGFLFQFPEHQILEDTVLNHIGAGLNYL